MLSPAKDFYFFSSIHAIVILQQLRLRHRHVMAEADRLRMAALFAANADFDVWAGFMAGQRGHVHQLPDTFDLQHFKWIVF
jgi:hypothetical protein